MDKRVLLVFSLFCCFEAGTALRCITCHLHPTLDRCRRGFGVCVAQDGEKCMTLNVYDYNWNHQLSYMVCQKFCRTLTFQRHGWFFMHTCCDYNYCNLQL
ncbi:prostate and testis expressed protein 3-like [Sturnira hondurensis]|uniref:prostate and testis expressed protein 3-like n=1 Tax=Sturnira hondurensis TaxID=192404 RepID=UPI00187A108F|nr:prostate and testis expressed protein 3-like [Sturnira hondurensis]